MSISPYYSKHANVNKDAGTDASAPEAPLADTSTKIERIFHVMRALETGSRRSIHNIMYQNIQALNSQ